MGIDPGNQMGTDMEQLPYLVGNSPSIALWSLGYPSGQGIQLQGMGILCTLIKYLNYSGSSLVHQIWLNNL